MTVTVARGETNQWTGRRTPASAFGKCLRNSHPLSGRLFDVQLLLRSLTDLWVSCHTNYVLRLLSSSVSTSSWEGGISFEEVLMSLSFCPLSSMPAGPLDPFPFESLCPEVYNYPFCYLYSNYVLINLTFNRSPDITKIHPRHTAFKLSPLSMMRWFSSSCSYPS